MRRALCLLLCCLLLLPFVPALTARGADAYSLPEPEVLQIDLLLQPSRYLRMIHSAEKQKYDAVVCMNEGEPQPIGVQVRGDRSLREGLEMASKRVPMELCFDYAEPDGTFRGNPSLKLINCLTPARLLTQLVAMQTFVFLDVPTPRITPAFIRINDTDFGLYLAVEDINEAFAQNWFGGASLYRPLSLKDDRNERTVVSFEGIEMVVKADGGGDTLAKYTEAKNRGENAEEYLEVDEFLRYMACETFIRNEDGFLESDRNFYLADDHGTLRLLPWDKDDVFLVFEDPESFPDIEHRYNPLFQDMMENETYYARYREYVKKLNDEFLNPDTFLPWLENYIRVLSPYFQRDETISLRSDDVFAELTTGNALFNTLTGNLLLTFRTYHDQVGALLSGEADSFFIPQGMTLASYDGDGETENGNAWGGDRSIVFRVCAGYWRLRRQAFMQNEGAVTVGIGVLFALVFVCTVVCVYRPLRRGRRRSAR